MVSSQFLFNAMHYFRNILREPFIGSQNEKDITDNGAGRFRR